MPPEAFEPRCARASGGHVGSPGVSVHSSGEALGQGAESCLSKPGPPDSNGFHDQLRKVCSQSMWRAGFRGILVIPMSCKEGRAHVWSLKHPRKIRELHSYTKKMKEPARKRSICDAL